MRLLSIFFRGGKGFVQCVSLFFCANLLFCTNAFFSIPKVQCILKRGYLSYLRTVFLEAAKKINICCFFLVNCLLKAFLPFSREACKKRLS